MRFEAPLLRQEGETGRAEAPRRGEASDAEIVLPGRGLQFHGQVVDLSTEGCRIETKCGLEPGTSVEVWLRTEGMPLRISASLLERRDRCVEFRFQPMPERKANQIRMLRRELGLEGGKIAQM
jgi:hypothetical protein